MTKREFPGCYLNFRILNLNIVWYFVLVIWCLAGTSCKPPLPVYFDKPIGTQVQGFDTNIIGNYIPLDDVLDKGAKEFSEKYTVKYDKIVPKNTDISLDMNGKNVNYNDVKEIMGTKNDSGKIDNSKSCDSLFKSMCSFNELVSSKLGSVIDKKGQAKAVAGMIKIAYDRIFFIALDSAGNNRRDTLFSLNPSVLLTKYSGKYFLNFKTPYGWEILQMDMWEDKFLSTRLFYFTNYNDCAGTVAELTSSTKNIYPDLKPILNAEKRVIGFKAILDPKVLLEKFKRSEESVLLLRMK